MARFNNNGSFDTAFGNRGIVSTAFPNASAGVRVVLLQPNSNIVAIGEASGGGEENLAAARYLGQ